MTNAIAKNYNEIDLFFENMNVPSSSKSEDGSEFSNIINNVSARCQKAQNNFDKKAKVSNTSSINKKALEKNEPKTQEADVPKKPEAAPKENKAQAYDEKKAYAKKEKTDTKEKAKQTAIEETKDNTQTQEKDTKKVQKNAQMEAAEQTAPKEDTNSHVESSPVFSPEENLELDSKAQEEISQALDKIDTTLQEITASISAVVQNTLDNNQDIKTQLKDTLEGAQDIQEITKIVENISNELDNSNLDQSQKDEATKALKEAKKLLLGLEEGIKEPTEFKEALQELKEKISSLMDGVMLEINESVENGAQLELDLSKSVVDKKDIEAIVEQSKVVDSKAQDKKALTEAAKKAQNLVKDIQDALDSKDFEKLQEVMDNLKETIKEIKTLTEGKNEDMELSLDKKLDEALKNLQDVFEKHELIALDDINIDDLKNINKNDQSSMDKLLDALNHLEFKSDSKESEKLKEQVTKLIEKINNNAITEDEIEEAVDILSKSEVKITHNTQKTTNSNVIELSSEFSALNLKTSKAQEGANDSESAEFENDFEFVDDFNIEEIKQAQNSDSKDAKKVTLRGKISKEDLTQAQETNRQKSQFTNEIMEDMMVDMKIEALSEQSGALSVADEVAKLALSESNTINSISAKGSFTYDPTGLNTIIKNIATAPKSPLAQFEAPKDMSDILNQITNKFEQLKDSSTQKLTMVLRPNDLGRLSIELTSNKNGLTTQIMAQNEDVKAYIEKNINTLRQQLSDAGVNVNSIQIKTAGQEGTSNYDGNQNFNKEQQENFNGQNPKNKNNQQQNDNKDAKDILASISNYDMQFAKDFSSVLNKTLNYNLN